LGSQIVWDVPSSDFWVFTHTWKCFTLTFYAEPGASILVCLHFSFHFNLFDFLKCHFASKRIFFFLMYNNWTSLWSTVWYFNLCI
jgi:hypothetical protein